MMTRRRAALLALSLVTLAPWASAGGGPDITEIRIEKARHTLTLMTGKSPYKVYRVAIGMGGAGPKRMEGDRVTPVGTYRVSGRIPGLFHQFLVLSYPNDA